MCGEHSFLLAGHRGVFHRCRRAIIDLKEKACRDSMPQYTRRDYVPVDLCSFSGCSVQTVIGLM